MLLLSYIDWFNILSYSFLNLFTVGNFFMSVQGYIFCSILWSRLCSLGKKRFVEGEMTEIDYRAGGGGDHRNVQYIPLCGSECRSANLNLQEYY